VRRCLLVHDFSPARAAQDMKKPLTREGPPH
jgi:hypothetical protein